MLEGLVATLLNRFLGMYVKNFDPKQLNVGIWSGDVKLTNLELRREALDQLHLPVNVVEGHLGTLILSIPWSNLRGKPVRVNVEDVYLLAAPKEDAAYDEDEEKKRAQSVKMEKLESAELLKERNTEGQSAEEQQKNQSFTDSLVTAIVDNVQISVKNIHLRYEDSIATPSHPFAIGFTLQEFSAVSTDGDWRPSFIQASSGTTHKLATLNALALYWNTDAKLYGTGKGEEVGAEAQKTDHNELMDKFRAAIEKGENHQYMLKPVSGRAGIEIDKTGKIEKPKVKARLLFNELGFILDEEQYRDALMLVDLFHYFLRHQEYRRLQPDKSPKEAPRAWIQFAGQAVLQKIQDRNRRWTWNYMRQRRDDRKRYIEIFKKKKKDEKLTPVETEDITKLEENLTYEDLRFWRSLARNELRKENVGVKKPQPKQTWTSWVWGSKPEEESKENQDTAMTEQQRKELYDAIDWDEKKVIADSVDLPRETVKLQIESSLQTGSFTLKRDPHGKATEVLSLMFDNFQAKALQRPDSFLADVALGGLRVYDGTTEGSLFPQIVKVKDIKNAAVDQHSVETLQSDDDTTEDSEAKKREKEDALFHLVAEQNPLDGSADSLVIMKLKSIEVIYNPRFVVEIAKFFKPPERHMESIGALMETAGATVEGIRQQTRAGLEFALQEHKTVNAQLDIYAPLIFIPESITKESSLCLILDAGHISLNSELVDKNTMRDIQSKQKTQYNEQDFKQLEGLMYDKFLLKLDSTQILLGPGIDATRNQLDVEKDTHNLRIVDRINMDFVLETSIIPKATDLTKTRISGHLPVLHASISDRKYKNLMKLIDIAIPKFDSDDPLDGRTNAPVAAQKAKNDNADGRPAVNRARSKSLQPEQRHDDLVVDEDHDEVTKQEKSTGEHVNLHQRNFEFKFTVDKLQGSLYRADFNSQKPDHLLVELVAEHFQLEFYLRAYDMVAEVLLKKLNVEDFIEENPSPEFKNIVSSEGFDAEEDKDLFNLKFVKVNADHPDFGSTYEAIATNLDVTISTLNLVVTRKTLLTLLDFVLVTFASPNEASEVPKAIDQTGGLSQKEVEPAPESPDSSDKIRIKIDLKSIAFILNNDGIRLATLSLNTADVGIFLAGGAMNIGARLGSLSLLDDVNQGASKDSALRQLVTIQGDELADFKYKTFDSKDKSYPGHDSEIFLRSGSIKINFLEEPFRKIIEFLVKFGKMQAIFNAARDAAANRASQMQENANKMRFDILVKTPIIVFPRAMVQGRLRDLITAYLGEIYASNRFVSLDSPKGAVANSLSAGIRNIRLTSDFHYDDNDSEELEMINKVDLDFKINYVDHQDGMKRPDLEIEGDMSPISLRIAQTQMKFLMELSQTVPGAFASDSEQNEQEALQDLPDSLVKPATSVGKIDTNSDRKPSSAETVSNQGPELSKKAEVWTKLDLVFKAPIIGLELILAKDDQAVGDLHAASLSTFALNDTSVKLKMMSDNALESELLVHSFTVTDSRAKETNKFKKVMSLINNDVKQQFMASVTISGGEEGNLIAMLTVDSPRIIFAMDYVFALQSFATTAFASSESLQTEENPTEGAIQVDDSDSIMSPTVAEADDATRNDDSNRAEGSSMSISFRVNIVDAQVILIANPTISNSEAIVLGTQEVLISQQNASMLQVTKVGMFLCRMDKFETSRLRILDDFSVQMSMDSKSRGKQSSLTSIHLNIEPLVLRLSLRDILLALQIFNKASEMTSDDSLKVQDSEPKKIKELKGSGAASTKRKSVVTRPTSTLATRIRKPAPSSQLSKSDERDIKEESTVMKREEMTAEVQGIRVILIGDLHELPLIDWSVKKFNVDVRDWSGSMTGDLSFDTYMNVYNFSKSAWEPLIEPWQLGFHVAKDQNPDHLSVEVYSHKMLELTVTSATIALASKSAQFLSTDEDVLSKPRGADSPYKIRNYTGFDLNVWAATGTDDQGSAAKLADGDEAPWRFEDPTTMRENLSPEGGTGVVGIKLEGSGFDSIERIPVNKEGETLYNLKPRKERVQHRLLVEVKLGSDNVKYITIRSPLLVENNTQIPVEIGVFSPEEGHLLKIEKILPGEGRPAPVGAAFMHSLVVRPGEGFGYAWSNERLFWKDLLKRSTRTITCKGDGDNESPPFYFQLNAAYDKNDPMTRQVCFHFDHFQYLIFGQRLPVHENSTLSAD